MKFFDHKNIKHASPCLALILICAGGALGQSRATSLGTKRQTKTGASVSLPQDLIRQFVSDDADVRKYVREGNDPAAHFNASLIDLNGDGKAEYEIGEVDPGSSPFCGVSGLCTFWLYRKVGDRWEMLLSAGGGLLLLKTRMSGYRDISSDSW